MRVYVVEASGKGGMIHYDFHLCRALQRNGIDTTLVTSTVYELRDLKHEFRAVELLHIWDPRKSVVKNRTLARIRRAQRGIQYILEWLRLIAYLRRERPDVVLFGEMRFPFEYYFLRMLRASKLKLAAVVHDVQMFDTHHGSATIVQSDRRSLIGFNRIYTQFLALFIHGKSNRELFLRLYDIPAERVHGIPLATSELILEVTPECTPEELRRRFNIAPDQHVVLFFGTLTKYKGLEDLIRAYPAVYRATGARLVVAGFPAKDVDVNAYRSLARELDIDDQISWFLEYVPNGQVAPLMNMSDVVVFPYRAITQSAVLQIAYACGKAVVATNIGGLPEVVEEGKSGLLVPPEDPDALARAIIRIVGDPALARHMGEHAKALAQERYSWRTVAEKMKTVFEGL